MREIRFRGMYRENGISRWAYGYVTIFRDLAQICSNDEVWNVIPESVGEFTGFHDKKHNPIYEGDICKYKFYIATSVDPDANPKIFEGVGVIQFIEGCFMINPVNNENPIPMHFTDLSIEIIGNIHQNKDLLK